MKLKDQVCSLELAKKLKKLGFKQNSLFYWVHCKHTNKWSLEFGERKTKKGFWVDEKYYAYTVAELGEKIPYKINSFYLYLEKCCDDDWIVVFRDSTFNKRLVNFSNPSLANAMAKMIIYLKKNNLI